jgi:hypothetical protein
MKSQGVYIKPTDILYGLQLLLPNDCERFMDADEHCGRVSFHQPHCSPPDDILVLSFCYDE